MALAGPSQVAPPRWGHAWRSPWLSPWLVLLARLYLGGGVFIAAAVPKIREPDLFALSIAAYEILPLSLVRWIAWTLPWLELVIGLSLILGKGFRPRMGAAGAAALLIVFIAAGSIVLAQGRDLACGCFGTPSVATGPEAGLWRAVADLLAWPQANVPGYPVIRDSLWLFVSIYVFAKVDHVQNPLGRRLKWPQRT